ncbi:hypothetical protein [Paraburkholderia adhaesiva]|uniref:hypothetical protein n=1 Tax=Paraburkholderia adhaesiva TaxID=2883244 RepID=UPI001F1E7870|nr:hypothetical protein [Paraburkholderia adhaesiva]
MTDAPRISRVRMSVTARVFFAALMGMRFAVVALVITGAAALILRLFRWAILKC